MSAGGDLLRTPLFPVHLAAGARLVPFGGWEMPVQYSSILAEHRAVRAGAGLFDLSHMGRLYFDGPPGRELLQRLSTNNVEVLAPGRAQYGLLCNHSGGILDDTVAYNLGQRLLLVVNASNRLKILDWIERQATPGQAGCVRDATFETAMIGLQGPSAEELLRPLTDLDLPGLRYYAALHGRVADFQVLAARTGYTGEDGFELIVSAAEAPRLWERLARLDAPLTPKLCGLGARDTLRLEAGMALYGHEITEQTNPYEANLGRVVKLDKGEFAGRQALADLNQQQPTRLLVGFQMIENAVPRQGYPISLDGQAVGEVTSGSFSPSLETNLGMAYLKTDLAEPGTEIDIVIRERPRRARVTPLPHYSHRTRRPARPSQVFTPSTSTSSIPSPPATSIPSPPAGGEGQGEGAHHVGESRGGGESPRVRARSNTRRSST